MLTSCGRANVFGERCRLARTFRGVSPLHGGGQGFESPRLHLENLLFSRQNVRPRKKAEFVALSFDSDLTVTHRCACSTLDECCVVWKQWKEKELPEIRAY